MFRQKEELKTIKNVGIFLVILSIIVIASFKALTTSQLVKGINLRVRELASKNIKIIHYQAELYKRDLELLANQLQASELDSEENKKILTEAESESFDQWAIYSETGELVFSSKAHPGAPDLILPQNILNFPHDELYAFRNSIGAVHCIRDPQNIVRGHLFGQISKESFSRTTQLSDYSQMGFATLFTEDGSPLIVSSEKSILKLQDRSFWEIYSNLRFDPPYSYEKLKNQIQKKQNGYTQYFTEEGAKRVAYFAPIGMNNWYIFQVATQEVIDLQASPLNQITYEAALLIVTVFVLSSIAIMSINSKNQKKLMEAQRQMERLTNGIRGGVLRFSTNTVGEIEYISDGYLRILGAQAEDIKEKYKNSFFQMICEEDRARVRGELEPTSLYANREINLEYRLIDKNDNLIWVIDKMTVIEENDKRYKFYSVVVDATNVKKTEADLRNTNENLKLVADTHMESRVFECDLSTGVIRFHKGYFLGYNLDDYNNYTIETMLQWSWYDPSVAIEISRIHEEMISGKEFSSGVIKLMHANTEEQRWIRIMVTKVKDENSDRVIGSMRDVTEEKEIQLKLSRETEKNKMMISGALFTGTINASQNSLTITSDGRGVNNHENISYNYIRKLQFIVATMIHPEDVEVFLSEFNIESIFRNYNKGNISRTIEYRRRIEGQNGYFWVRATMRIIKEVTSGDILCFVYVNDIDHDIKITQMLRQKAETDYLTGLFNRDGLISRIEEYLSNCREGEMSAFYSIDLDDFKLLNDSYGHLEGDKFLKLVGDTLTHMFRKDDLIGRMGGDEFVVFLKDCPSEEFVIQKAKAILEHISALEMEGVDYESHASIGMAIAPINGTTFRDLYDASDRALYTSKKSGKNIYSVYETQEEN